MKKYSCDRCGTSLTDKDGKALPHYNMKDPKSKHLRKKNESLVCAECVESKEREKERVKEVNG